MVSSSISTPATLQSASPSPGSSSNSPQGHPAFGATDIGLILMAVVWGINYSVVKVGLGHLSPLAFNGARLGMAAVLLFVAAAFVRGVDWPSGVDRRKLLWIGLLGNGLYQLFFIFGLNRTRAGIAALIVAATPAWIAIALRLMGREHVSRLAWFSIALQLAGVGCVVGSAQGSNAGEGTMLGAILIACGSICWALFTVLLQPYTARFHPVHLSAVTMLSGALAVAIIAAPEVAKVEWHAVPFTAWAAVAYAGVGALVIAYLLYYRGVRILGPTRAAMYGNLQPVAALLFAWIMLHEKPGGWQLTGAGLILGGLLLSRLAGSASTASDKGGTAAATSDISTVI